MKANLNEFLFKILDFESKLHPNDVEKAQTAFLTIHNILRATALDKQKIIAFSLLRQQYKDKKVPGFSNHSSEEQKYLIDVSLQAADHLKRCKIAESRAIFHRPGQSLYTRAS